jgi:pyruvate/2-oxoglutarate dehydrogenase complex dihydrolipoamide acyltransferase (E2) component
MARSRSEIPEATVWVDVDATALIELRAGLKKSDPKTRQDCWLSLPALSQQA